MRECVLYKDENWDLDQPPPFAPMAWGDNVFRRCGFDALDLEGVMFDGIMDCCTISSCDLYWAFFNVALVSGSRFDGCTFRGASFRGTTFIDCTFVDCAFKLDNLGADCTIDDCLLVSCRFEGCSWVKKGGADKRDVTKTRWLDCTMERCTGMKGMF